MQEIKSGGVRTKHHGERPKHKSEKKINFSVNFGCTATSQRQERMIHICQYFPLVPQNHSQAQRGHVTDDIS